MSFYDGGMGCAWSDEEITCLHDHAENVRSIPPSSIGMSGRSGCGVGRGGWSVLVENGQKSGL